MLFRRSLSQPIKQRYSIPASLQSNTAAAASIGARIAPAVAIAAPPELVLLGAAAAALCPAVVVIAVVAVVLAMDATRDLTMLDNGAATGVVTSVLAVVVDDEPSPIADDATATALEAGATTVPEATAEGEDPAAPPISPAKADPDASSYPESRYIPHMVPYVLAKSNKSVSAS